MDPNRDYIGDPYLRGIVSAIPPSGGCRPPSFGSPWFHMILNASFNMSLN